MRDLFDYGRARAEAREAADAGIDQSSKASGELWKALAIDFVRRYLTGHASMYADQLWEAGLTVPKSPRALGAVMRHAEASGWMRQKTHDGFWLALPSVNSHGSMVRVWESRIYVGRTL